MDYKFSIHFHLPGFSMNCKRESASNELPDNANALLKIPQLSNGLIIEKWK